MTAWHTFEASSLRIKEAIKAGTMDVRDDRHFTWTPLLLDRTGWETIVAGIDGLYRHVVDEQIAAEARVARSGEQPIPVTAILAAFESPRGPNQVHSSAGDRWRDPIAVSAAAVDAPLSFSSNAQALVGPLRLDIMSEAAKRDVSPQAFFEQHGGGSVRDVVRHFETLRKHDWLGLVEPADSRKHVGPAERLYRVTKAPVFDADVWSALPGSTKAVVSARIFESLSRRVREAKEAGTLDAREGWRFCCTAALLDRLGWEKLIARTDILFKFLFGEQARTKQRLTHSSEEPFFATVVLMAFESPGGPPKPPRFLGDLQRAGPPTGR